MGNTTHKKETLCWRCEKACGDCSWSDGSFTPVEGWKARKTTLPNNYIYTDSYLVYECPLFVDDTHRYNKSPKRNIFENEVVKEIMIRRRNPEEVLTTNKSDARKRIEKIPENDLRKLIDERLSGTDRDIAICLFIGHLTIKECAKVLYYSETAIKKRWYNIIRKLE